MTKNLHVCTIYCRPEVDNDVISGTVVDNVSVNVLLKFGDSSSNGFRDSRGADFVSHERTLAKPIPIVRNAKALRLKTQSINQFFIRCTLRHCI